MQGRSVASLRLRSIKRLIGTAQGIHPVAVNPTVSDTYRNSNPLGDILLFRPANFASFCNINRSSSALAALSCTYLGFISASDGITDDTTGHRPINC